MSAIHKCVAFAFLSVLLVSGGCGKKSDDGQSEKADSKSSTPHVDASLSTQSVPFGDIIRAAGFEVVYVNPFPSRVPGDQGRMILYNSAHDGDDGGILFAETGKAGDVGWVWHWYFEDQKPKVFERLDIDKDGLWDIRVYTDDGHFDLVQDATFELGGGNRVDRIALNGSCSESEADHPLWHCFDGNVKSAWRSRMEGNPRPFIELYSPLGLADGILSIKAMDQNQPRDCEVYADGEKIQSIELRPTTDEQLIQLDAKARTARKIRLEIKSCHQDCVSVAIAELQIR